jgi:threonine/homoserine/homoserine lactone efflux protein
MAAMMGAFVVVSLALTLLPGPDLLFVIRSLGRTTGLCMIGLGIRTAIERT